ncbi:hypothetical protein AAE478_006366 [Parahypoxylon ruwenzoriense]
MDDTDQRARREAEKIRQYFRADTTNFKFEGMLGNGLTNVACKIKFRNRWWRRGGSEVFVVKRSFRPNQEEDLRKENDVLRTLRGAMHIIQPYRIRENIRNPLDNAPGTSVLMEFAENGSLGDFVERRMEWHHELPNRMLLRIFRCLMIGSFDPRDREHDLFPVLKLIDFERARDYPDPNRRDLGVKDNIRGIGLVMAWLIQGSREAAYPAFRTLYLDNGHTEEILSYANLSPARFRNLDTILRNLIVRSCAVSPNERPTLEELDEYLRRMIDGATSRSYRHFPRGQFETDRRIKKLLRHLVLDASD